MRRPRQMRCSRRVRCPWRPRRLRPVSPGPLTPPGARCGRHGGGTSVRLRPTRGSGVPRRRTRVRRGPAGQGEPPRGPRRRSPGRVTRHARRCGARRPVARVAVPPRGRRRCRRRRASRGSQACGMRRECNGRRVGRVCRIRSGLRTCTGCRVRRMRQQRNGRQAGRVCRTLRGPRTCSGCRTLMGHRMHVESRVLSRTSRSLRPVDPTRGPDHHAPVTWPARRCVPRGFRRSGSEPPPGTRESRAGGGAEGPSPALPRPVRPWRTAAPRHRSGSWQTGWATPST